MNKIKKILKNKKIIFGLVGLLLVCLIIGFCFLRFNDSQEYDLTAKMKEMGKDFYENFYYEQVGVDEEQRVAFLKKFETIGIKVNLDNLSRYNLQDSDAVLSQFVNKKTKQSCDKTNTQVIIYPTSPYDKTSYNLEVNLDCGFNEE